MTWSCTGAYRRLLFCLVASGAIHSLFWAIESGSAPRSKSSPSETSRRTKTLDVRLALPRALPAEPVGTKTDAAGVAEPPSPSGLEIEEINAKDGSKPEAAQAEQTRPSAGESILASPYYPAAELSERPDFIDPPAEADSEIPDGDRGGTATISFYVAANGDIDRAEIERSSMTPAQDEWLLKKLRLLKLRPGRLNGQQVPSKWVLEFELAPESEANK